LGSSTTIKNDEVLPAILLSYYSARWNLNFKIKQPLNDGNFFLRLQNFVCTSKIFLKPKTNF